MSHPLLPPRVALVQMPFAVTSWPSLGLSLLKSSLQLRGIASRVIYFNSLFSRTIGGEDYKRIAGGQPQNSDLLGEWIFASSMTDETGGALDSYFDEVIRGSHRDHRKSRPATEFEPIIDTARRARQHVEGFLDDCVLKEPWADYDIVGFTSVFQQHLASLALAKRLKSLHPHLTIVFGGANCEGDMGRATLAAFPFVDAVCVGEGDIAFPAFVTARRDGDRGPIPGMMTRSEPASAHPVAPPMVDLDSLPFPDFDDFFRDETNDSTSPRRLLFETSRGCWWGQKNHCTFCGLNGQNMKFRHKSADRALAELIYLRNRFNDCTNSISATDNIIPYEYFRTFLPKLSELNLQLDIFYETKSNLRKDQLLLYRAAGLRSIQPGIESLQTDVLKLMKKGVSSLQNIQLLKWCKEIGIEAHWNYLYGFPQEDEGSYARAADLVKSVVHLGPPVAVARLRFDRFSPYVTDPARYGITEMRPYRTYDFIYSQLTPTQRQDIAYYFVGQIPQTDQEFGYAQPLRDEVERWKRDEDQYTLTHLTAESFILVFDTRESNPRAVMLAGLYDILFRQCDAITSVEQLMGISIENGYTRQQFSRVMSDFRELRLIAVENDNCLGLSIPLGAAYAPGAGASAKLEVFYSQTEGGETENSIDINMNLVDILTIIKGDEHVRA